MKSRSLFLAGSLIAGLLIAAGFAWGEQPIKEGETYTLTCKGYFKVKEGWDGKPFVRFHPQKCWHSEKQVGCYYSVGDDLTDRGGLTCKQVNPVRR